MKIWRLPFSHGKIQAKAAARAEAKAAEVARRLAAEADRLAAEADRLAREGRGRANGAA